MIPRRARLIRGPRMGNRKISKVHICISVILVECAALQLYLFLEGLYTQSNHTP
jgi:hypothetical protein